MLFLEKDVFVKYGLNKDATTISANEELEMKRQARHYTNTSKL